MLHKVKENLNSKLSQLGFYSRRLRKENITKLVVASTASLALVLQLTVGILPSSIDPVSANHVPSNYDMAGDALVAGGVRDKAHFLSIYDTNSSDLKEIYSHFGVTRQDINNAKMGSFYTDSYNGQLKVLSRMDWPGHGRSKVNVPGANTSIYTGPWIDGANGRHQQLEALVGKRAVDGQWFAIVLDCANLVYVTPPQPPKPKPAAVCTSLSIDSLSRNSFKFSARATVSNGATISGYHYTVTKDGTQVLDRTVATTGTSSAINYTAPEDGTYTARVTVQTSVGAKTADACAKQFTVKPKPEVKMIKVCELDTKDIITIREEDFDSSKHSKDYDDCDIKVCDLATKTIISIRKDDFDDSKHSTDLSDCDEVPVTPPAPQTPPELPKTGVGETVTGALGIGSIIAAAGYYVASRRNLLSALLNR